MAILKFEQALKRLEKIVDELEKGELSLDDSLKRYEEGIKLSRFCTSKLEEIERKVEILTKNKEGKFEKIPYEENDFEKEVREEKENYKGMRRKKKKIDNEGLLFEEDK